MLDIKSVASYRNSSAVVQTYEARHEKKRSIGACVNSKDSYKPVNPYSKLWAEYPMRTENMYVMFELP